MLGFEIGDSVERVHQQSARTWVQGQRHRVYGEVPATQIFVDGVERDFRLARLGIALGTSACDLRPYMVWEENV